ncbi:ARM repeat-containing protein [Cristinia sonorae]|uniref:ARM repeat-containing protein n=1 Tax=Cristinia sonorae TaxID=1940300 RepID=A0A8K0ULA4_9AGAR|nr:ARM repeat-containing protein [Cristinia sonorae]
MPTNKTSLKRPASSHAEPKAKKAHSANPSEKTTKRSRPVTQPLQADDEASSDEGDDLDNGDGEVELEEGGEEAVRSSKDPNATRESHQAQKQLQQQRRAAKPHSALLAEAKKAWSLARQKNTSKEERTKHVKSLMDIVRGQVTDIVFKHDASRIIQTIVKHGGTKERNEIASELKGHYQALAQNKYSKFLVTKLIRLCPTHRTSILLEFQGNVRRLLLHREASSVLADAFELYANAYERSLLLKDFYGKEASLFTVTTGSTEDKEKSKLGLAGLLRGTDKDRKRRVLSAMKENLISIFNNPDKGAVSHAIVHRALWEYLIAVDEIGDEAEREKLRRDIFESCQDVLAEMVHTKDGSRAVRDFIAQGSAKDRKHIIKAIKPHVERMCTDDEAQLVLFTALDVIDDTKLTAKSLVADVTSAASTIYKSPQGRRSLIYLVSPRTRRHFTPAQISLLAETDLIRAKTSKKDDKVRSEEIRKAASESLLRWISEKTVDIVRDPGGSLVVGEVMLYAEGDKSDASAALVTLMSSSYPSEDPANPHLITLPHVSRLYKLLVQGGHFSQITKSIERSPLFSPLEFAVKFIDVVGRDNIVVMAQEEAAFVVAALCETVLASDQEGLPARKLLKSWLGGDVKQQLAKDSEQRGRKLLLEQIAAL